MSNKSYKIKYDLDKPSDDHIKVKIEQDFDFLEVLSVKITQEDAYKTYTSDYGVIVGRVIANEGFGIPNAKISIFIKNENNDETKYDNIIYPYTNVNDKNQTDVRYNLLPSKKNNKCHQNVGTFESKNNILDNNVNIEVFNNYYKYTTVTNQSGDYMIFGVPIGLQEIHVDVDLSDIGILSQTPRDMTYKGYSLKQFDSPNKFKNSKDIDSLSQIITENTTVFVYPFWGDNGSDEIAITKKSFNLQYKFEPTCVFIGSIFTDSPNSYINKNCKPSKTSGKMSEMVSSQGSIEMIRETIDGKVEEFNISGSRVIDENGVWCYQIPMNLDYVITDEQGNLIPTKDSNKGIPTRANVRFRITLDDNGDEFTQGKTGVYLVPNNPNEISKENYDFSINSDKNSFVNLMWNKVYTVKNYIPRLQKTKDSTRRDFIGLKSVNFHENNNPSPYNNIFINLNIKFKVLCLIAKLLIKLVGGINSWVISLLNYYVLSNNQEIGYLMISKDFLSDCNFLPQSENPSDDISNFDYFVPFSRSSNGSFSNKRIIKREYFGVTLLSAYNIKNNTDKLRGDSDVSIDEGDGELNINNINVSCQQQQEQYNVKVCFGISGYIYSHARFYPNLVEDLSECIETQLSIDNEVVNFDFNNDWVNGSLYAPRFYVKTKLNKNNKGKNVKYCGSKSVFFNIIQTCAPIIDQNGNLQGDNSECIGDSTTDCYKKSAEKSIGVGILNKSNEIYYYKSNVFNQDGMFHYLPTGIILIGSLNDNDIDGIPLLHQLLPSTSFKLPPDTPDLEDGYVEMSGIDWGEKNGDENYRRKGLFVGIKCLDSDTKLKTCINASRMCEVGVDFDESFDYIDENNVTINVESDGFININEISDSDVRGMFSTLNFNNLSVNENEYKHKKYDFKYNYPDNFDGRLKDYTGDTISNDYKSFRLSNNPVSYIQNQFHRYENSFYFYFGIKPGNTAIDVFNRQYFVPCTETSKLPFNVIINNISDEDPGNETLGSFDITIIDFIHPAKLYIDNILKQSNITSSDEITITGLTSGIYEVKVIDGNSDVVIRSVSIGYIPSYEYTNEFLTGELELEYIPEYNYTVELPIIVSDYVDEEENIV